MYCSIQMVMIVYMSKIRGSSLKFITVGTIKDASRVQLCEQYCNLVQCYRNYPECHFLFVSCMIFYNNLFSKSMIFCLYFHCSTCRFYSHYDIKLLECHIYVPKKTLVIMHPVLLLSILLLYLIMVAICCQMYAGKPQHNTQWYFLQQ